MLLLMSVVFHENYQWMYVLLFLSGTLKANCEFLVIQSVNLCLGTEYLYMNYHVHIEGDNFQSLYFMSTDAQLNLLQPLLLIVLSLLMTPNC